jgi:enolase
MSRKKLLPGRMAGYISGAPRSGERLSKHNCALRFEEELGSAARFAGPQIFAAQSSSVSG